MYSTLSYNENEHAHTDTPIRQSYILMFGLLDSWIVWGLRKKFSDSWIVRGLRKDFSDSWIVRGLKKNSSDSWIVWGLRKIISIFNSG